MDQTIKPEPTANLTRPPVYPKPHNLYTKMSSRRAIACTICAKAKTKCDKAVPSCSRCTAKGLQCEPRSTRRTTDNSSYHRNTKKHMVSPKRYSSTHSVPTLSRHTSPRSVPSSERHQHVRTVSQMDFHTAAKLARSRPDFATMPILTPPPSYTPQIIDECYSYSSSPEPSMAAFPPSMEKSSYFNSGRMTPGTPDSFSTYSEPLPLNDAFDQYTNSPAWPDNGLVPIGLGFENDIPGLIPSEADMRMWTPDFEGSSTPMGPMGTFESPICGSPQSVHSWPNPPLSVSPPLLPHTRAVPSLSMSESSLQDFDSPVGVQDEWSSFMGKAAHTSAPYFDTIKATIPKNSQLWDDSMLTRSSTF